MDEAKFSRWGLLGGVGTAVLLVAGGFLAGSPPKVGDSDTKIVTFITDHQDALKVSSYLGGVAGVLFLWFLGSLYSRLRQAEGGTGRLARVGLTGGIVAITIAFAGNAIAANAALHPSAGLYRLASNFYGYVGFAAAVFVAAVSVLIWSTGLLPKWFGYAGEVLAVGWFVAAASVSTESDAIFVVGFVVFLVWAVWLAALSVMLYRQPATA